MWTRHHAGVESKFGYAGRVIDTHCHLSFPQFDPDREAVLRRARQAGVRLIINPGTDPEQSRAAVTLAGLQPDVYAAVGVHPHAVGTLTDDDFSELQDLARSERVVAIGEVGLEVSSRSPSLAVQLRWLERFVRLADELNKPVIFHVRNAHQEFRAFLECVWVPAKPRRSGASPAKPRRSGVAHCFSGALEDARFYVQHGLLLGVTGIVTFPNANELRAVLRRISLDHLLVETDAPFLAPQAYRGQRNEPAYVQSTAQALASLFPVALDDVELATDASAKNLFRIP